MELSEKHDPFIEKTEEAFKELLDLARAKNELHFALSLAPEFRGIQDSGWCTWVETNRAFDEYLEFINQKTQPTNNLRTRVALSFYCHLSEASGFYEAPKNLLRVAGGENHEMRPFLNLNRNYKKTGDVIAPNANKVFKDLIGHAKSLDLTKFSEVLRDAFDPDIRNAYAHADYIIAKDGLRIRKQAGGFPQLIKWNDFTEKLFRGINFYYVLRELIREAIRSFHPAKEVKGSMGEGPEFKHTIQYDSKSGALTISTAGFF